MYFEFRKLDSKCFCTKSSHELIGKSSNSSTIQTVSSLSQRHIYIPSKHFLKEQRTNYRFLRRGWFWGNMFSDPCLSSSFLITAYHLLLIHYSFALFTFFFHFLSFFYIIWTIDYSFRVNCSIGFSLFPFYFYYLTI